ncbi:hypothetical protein D3C73_1503500 [compost metagenome]
MEVIIHQALLNMDSELRLLINLVLTPEHQRKSIMEREQMETISVLQVSQLL